jgi:hypothetical protein
MVRFRMGYEIDVNVMDKIELQMGDHKYLSSCPRPLSRVPLSLQTAKGRGRPCRGLSGSVYSFVVVA